MLLELRIENLLLIDRAELRPGDWLNADHGRDRRRQDRAGARARPAAGRQAALGDREARGRGGLRGGRLRAAPGLCRIPSWPTSGARRTPTSEVVLARRVSAEGRTRAYVHHRSSTAADLRDLGGRLLSFFGQHEHRKLTVAGAQLDLLDGFAGRAPGAARAGGRGARARARGRTRARGATRAARARATATSTCSCSRSRRSRSSSPSEEEESALLEAERERLRQVDGLRAAAAAGGEAIAPEDGPGAAALLAEAERLADGGGRAPTPSWTPWPSGCAACGSRRRTSARSCGATSRGSTPTPSGCTSWRSASTPTTGSSASTAARSRRCSSTPSAAAPSATGWRTPRSRSSRRRPRSTRPWPSGRRSPKKLTAARGEGGARSWPKRVLEELDVAGHGGRLVLGRARAARGDRPIGRGAGGVHARAQRRRGRRPGPRERVGRRALARDARAA